MINPPPRRWGVAVPTLVLLLFCACVARGEPQVVNLGSNVTLELVEIPAGVFLQGSPTGEAGRKPDETQREVHITRPFHLGKFPVTRGQFARFVIETGFRTEAEKGASGGFGWNGSALVQQKIFTWQNPGFPQDENHPVTMITYADAQAFLSWLSRKAGRAFRLPTEAEWEYACRAGTTTAVPGGNDAADLDAVAWHKGNAGNGTRPLGRKRANAWGLHDMLGNVWEWCEDWYGPYPAGAATDPVQTNPTLSDKPRRVLRGGSWLREAVDCRSASRYRNDPGSRNADNGFRVLAYPNVASSAPAAEPAGVAASTQAESETTTPQPPPVDLEAEVPPAPTYHPPSEDYTHYVHQPPRQSWGFPLVLILGAGALVAFLRGLFRRGTGAGISAASSANTIPHRIADDGFWIHESALAPGTPVVCRYVVDGIEQEVQVAYEAGPEGHFVYTGRRPLNVIAIIAGASRTRRSRMQATPPPLRERRSPPIRPRHESFQGFPPAY